jgi:hypothetical protein
MDLPASWIIVCGMQVWMEGEQLRNVHGIGPLYIDRDCEHALNVHTHAVEQRDYAHTAEKTCDARNTEFTHWNPRFWNTG